MTNRNSDAIVLAYIKANPASDAERIARAAGVKSGTAHHAVARLEAKGCVVRKRAMCPRGPYGRTIEVSTFEATGVPLAPAPTEVTQALARRAPIEVAWHGGL